MADIRLARPKFTHRLASAGSDRCGWLKSSACSQDVALRAQRSFAPEALHLLHSYYDLMCQSRSLLPASLCRLAGQSSQLGPPTAGLSAPSRRYLRANLSPDAWTHTPAASGVLLPVSSPRASAFPKAVSGRRSADTHATTSARRTISELQSFLYVQASRFACHPDRSHRCHFLAGRPWRLLPSTA